MGFLLHQSSRFLLFMVADDEGHGTNETADRHDAVGIEDSGVGVVADNLAHFQIRRSCIVRGVRIAARGRCAPTCGNGR